MLDQQILRNKVADLWENYMRHAAAQFNRQRDSKYVDNVRSLFCQSSA